LTNEDLLSDNIERFSEIAGRITLKVNDRKFTEKIEQSVKWAFEKISELQKENPYGVPYKPHVWGVGWGIQSLGVKQLFLHVGFSKIFTSEYAFIAMNYILGCHPGENTASFASGVGVKSLTVAYGVNRDEWSNIPGGCRERHGFDLSRLTWVETMVLFLATDGIRHRRRSNGFHAFNYGGRLVI
jgi:hypothetical protein